MRLKLITLAVGSVYGMTRRGVASAAWLWFDWEYDRRGQPVRYRFKWVPKPERVQP